MKRTYHGSCHCKAIKFEADIDLAAVGTGKCNCTSCWKRRWWSVKVAADDFRSLGGEESFTKPGGKGFCKGCGVTPYNRVDAAEWNDGAYVSANVACLDDLDPAELIAAPVQYFDGLHDNWWNPPAETRHL